ncbi:AmiR/NasT family two-component response regulator [Lachnospiraceae bacterium PF1-21]|uniref:ANTAR domain-containing protein n=1 Tax=Ohessyouella blattaphilus TaxID=2949333 RepID=A0ABT1EDT8_9FIRM|nr:ANTAR domain-containing protein [Ohessyouella blattaphilus]MCP1108864.1 ANTAR domain-containing protein [Ohessyouella blattaphilus]MCR8562258.1 ANTAR domain-containing protein [Ohessyouella blattaphilus]MDL2249085.1 ANTAR domain-containing protein [Lachnospiraceae bacterium OttesenSCG-928-J05]
MFGVIVVFPNKDNGINIRNLLTKNGIEVLGVCTTGAQALQLTETLERGVVISGYRLADMMVLELRDYLPKDLNMLLITAPENLAGVASENIIGLPMPLKGYELINTVGMLINDYAVYRKKKRKQKKMLTEEEKAIVAQAKELLIGRNQMTEEEAHRFLQKSSMDKGQRLVDTALEVISIRDE